MRSKLKRQLQQGRMSEMVPKSWQYRARELEDQGPVVRRVDNAIRRINHYPVDKC